MNSFRFDVILKKQNSPTDLEQDAPSVSAPEPCSLDALRALLSTSGRLRVTGGAECTAVTHDRGGQIGS